PASLQGPLPLPGSPAGSFFRPGAVPTRACLRLGGLLARTEQNQRRNTVLYRTPPVCWGFPNQLSSDSWAVGLRRADPCSALGCETTSGSGSRIFCPAGKA